MVGKIYTDKSEDRPALMAVECNPGSPGIVTQMELMRRQYSNFYIWKRPLRADGGWTKEYGWWTTTSTRPIMIETGVGYIKKGWLLINSPFLIDEMRSFVNVGLAKGKKHLAHAPLYHDDRILALFIAISVAHENEQRLVAEDRRLAWDTQNAPPEAIVQLNTLGLSWEDAITKWEQSVGI